MIAKCNFRGSNVAALFHFGSETVGLIFLSLKRVQHFQGWQSLLHWRLLAYRPGRHHGTLCGGSSLSAMMSLEVAAHEVLMNHLVERRIRLSHRVSFGWRGQDRLEVFTSFICNAERAFAIAECIRAVDN